MLQVLLEADHGIALQIDLTQAKRVNAYYMISKNRSGCTRVNQYTKGACVDNHSFYDS